MNSDFIALLSKIMDCSHSRILINGHLSNEIKIERSVRQGDPIAMHLFVIYLHPLVEKLVEICAGDLDLVTAYADDVTVITCEVDKIDEVRRVFEDFGCVSGSKLNLAKTTAIDVGDTSRISRMNLPRNDWLNMQETVKILGIEFQNNQRSLVSENWKKIILGITRLLNAYRGRILSIHQKIIICNTFVTSKIWFASSVLNITNENIGKITSLLRWFIWGNYHPRVGVAQLALPVSRGGLNLHIPAIKCKALLINRQLSTIGSTPYAAGLLNDPASSQRVPSYCPCIKLVRAEIVQLPHNILQNLSSGSICDYTLSNMPDPPFVEDDNANWTLVWKNTSSKCLSSEERSLYYLLVHRKVPCRENMHNIGRADSPLCVNCSMGVNETIIHRYAACDAIKNIWQHTLGILRRITGTNRLNFEMLACPELAFVRRHDRFSSMKLFINYIKYVIETPIVSISIQNFDSYIACIQ